jgi:hypothetical protein
LFEKIFYLGNPICLDIIITLNNNNLGHYITMTIMESMLTILSKIPLLEMVAEGTVEPDGLADEESVEL